MTRKAVILHHSNGLVVRHKYTTEEPGRLGKMKMSSYIGQTTVAYRHKKKKKDKSS